MKKAKFKIIILILIFTSIFLTTIDTSENFRKNNDKYNNLFDFSHDDIHLNDFPNNYTNFNYYKIITINPAKVNGSGSHTNFPLLISIVDEDLHDNVLSNGNDIAFAIDNEWLDHEIELFNQSYSSTQAQLVAWVRIPSLSTSDETNITMYYGNSNLASQENPNGVWDSNYKGVWHLKEDPSGSQIKDSTSNSFHGTSYGLMSSNNQVEGQIGGSLKFDGLNDYINLGSHLGLKLTGAFTIEAWFNGIFNTTENKRSPIYCNGFSYSENIGIRVQGFHDPQFRTARVSVGDGSSYNFVASNYDINDNVWTHLVCNYNGSTLKLYINGTKQDDELITDIAYNTNNATIGANLDDAQQWFEGIIDELRVINKTFSADWIATEYNNQYSPETFFALSAEYKVSKIPLNSNFFKYYKEITVDHTEVNGSGSHTNFPLLISIIDEDLHDDVQSDGDDIAFSIDDEWLDHEIELFNQSYSSTEAQLIAWVRIPSLSTSIDTKITMYYGNSTIGRLENPTGVWDSNFVGVWHLKETGTGAINEYIDSSKYGNHGQGGLGNVSYLPNQIAGPIGFGQDFVDHFIDCGNHTTLDITTNQITVQLWMKYPSSTHSQMGPFNHKGYNSGYRLYMNLDSQYINFQLPGDESSLQTSQNISTNIWHHTVATYNGSLMRIYVDGKQDVTTLPKTNNIESALPAPFRIGHGDHPEGEVWSYPWLGQIDEVRISNVSRSADWIATEYNNHYSPETFFTFSAEYNVSKTPPNFDFFSYYKIITVNYTKVNGSGSHINFPLLISIIDEDLHNDTQSDGADIAFAIDNAWLDHEIELFNQSYSSTEAQLIVWIRVPSLSTSIDTNITMYYGNSTMSTRENPSGVWDKNFIGVWHLSETSGGTNMIKDSTSNENNGTDVNNPDLGVNGKIGKSVYFDDNPYINCGNDGSLNITNEITIEVWTYAEPNVWESAVLAKGGEENGAYSLFYFRSSGSNDVCCHLQDVTGTALQTGVQVSRNEWMHTVLTYNGSSIQTFKNGDLASSDAASGSIATNSENLYIGYENQYNDNFIGFIDEIRISNVSRSAEWIATEYNNQHDPDSFYSIGTENQIGADTSAPDITIDSPNTDDFFGSNAPDYNLTVIDANLDSIWYSLDGGLTNSTPVPATGTINQDLWSARPDGYVTIRIYANDTLGNIDYKEVTVRKDTIDPSIDSINSPLPGVWFSNNPPDYSLSITETNLDEIWYTLDGGLNNYSGGSSGTINSTAWSNAGQGNVTIIFYVNDFAGNWDSANVEIKKDTINPSIDSINSPLPGVWFSSTPPDYSLSITETNLDEIWYTLDNGLSNYSGGSSGTINSTAWSNAGQGNVTIIFYVNDSAGNWDLASVGVTKTSDLSISINSPNAGEWFKSIPDYDVYVSGNDRDSIWYTLDNGLNNFTITSNANLTNIWFGLIDSIAWGNATQGSITITFYLNNTFGISVFDNVQVNKDTIYPSIDNIDSPSSGAWFSIAPPSYSLSITEANINDIWYTLDGGLNNYTGSFSGTIDSTAWSNADQGNIMIIFYVNDSAGNWDSVSLGINRDTVNPSIDSINSPSPGVWFNNTPPSYSLSITEANIDEIWYTLDGGLNNYTGDLSGTIDSTAWGNVAQGSVTIIFYVKDSAGNQDSASVVVNRGTNIQPSQPSEFPLWIIIVIIGAAIGGIVGFIVLKKSKSKKAKPIQISQKQPVLKPKLKIPEQLTLFDYEALKDKNSGELNTREKKILDYIGYLEENKDFTKAAEFFGELIIIEGILGDSQKAKSYQQKQIDIAIKGLNYLKDQYEIESKNAAISGDYSKALELYKESQIISENLKIYVENQESYNTKKDAIMETKEPQVLVGEVEIVFSCINDLLTKYFDEIGIKFYSNPQIYDKDQNQIHGLILTDDKSLIADIDPSIRDKIKSIQIIYTEELSNKNLIKLCKNFQNPYAVLIIIGIKWPKNIEAQTIEIPKNKGIKYRENIRINHYELFTKLIGLKGVYETAFNEIIDLYNKSQLNILRETHESSEIIIHSTNELLYDLKEKGLVKHKLKEYFQRKV